jgi:hypothetical protein
MPRLLRHGKRKKISGTIAKVRVAIDEEFRPTIPVLIPDIQDIRDLAIKLHRTKENWQGNVFGWDAEYISSLAEAPENSQMTFTPATFWIGDATIWGFSMMWEDGDDQPPVETVSNWNVIEEMLLT